MIGILSVSGKQLTDCTEIIAIMKKLGLNGNISRNMTVLDGELETGCNVAIASEPVKTNVQTLWNELKSHFGLKCAHVEFKHHESDCVYNIFRQSSCPGAD